VKTYYELLGISATAGAEEVKSAFRKEIARYHPDKVHHLGQEFQEMASTRAAELTEAYRILMDPAARAAYDTSLANGSNGPAVAAPSTASAYQPPPQPAAAPAEAARSRPVSENLRETRESVSAFVRKATINRIRDVIQELTGSVDPSPDGGFDAAFLLRAKRGLFQKAEPPVHLRVKVVEYVDAATVASVWPVAMRIPAADAAACVLLCGTGVAPARELASAISEQRRRNRQTVGPTLIPVDTRDWEALVPPDTPGVVRKMLDRLKPGK
jgi:curved DNA-binding protein CbpA